MWCFSRKPQSWAGSPGPEKVPSGAQDFPRSTFSLRVDVSVCVCVCVCVCVAYTLPCIHSQALPGFVGPGRRVWGHHTAPGTTQAKFTASEEMFENTSQCY